MSLIKDLFQAGKIIPQAEHPLSKLVVTSKLKNMYIYIKTKTYIYTGYVVQEKCVFSHSTAHSPIYISLQEICSQSNTSVNYAFNLLHIYYHVRRNKIGLQDKN